MGGPTDIGRTTAFTAADYEIPDSDSDFLKPKVKHVESDNLLGEKKRVTEIGTAEDFDAANYNYPDGYRIDEDRGLVKVDTTKTLVGQNQTVAAIGVVDNFNPPDYNIPESYGLTDERVRHMSIKENLIGTKPKVSDIGIAENFVPYKAGEELKKKTGTSESKN